MSLIVEHDRIYKTDEKGNEIAYVIFKPVSDGVVDVVSTYVDDSCRGMGLGSELMQALADGARKQHIKLTLSCPYAVNWFSKHPSENDLLIQHAV